MQRPRLSFCLAFAASGGMLLPASTVHAADPVPPAGQTPAARPAPLIHDVALGTEGTLLGMVVDAQGVPLPKVPVMVRQANRDAAKAVTGADGRFTVSGLRGGVYDVAAGQGSGTFRLWAVNTAPPTAKNGVLVVATSQIVRGQVLDALISSDAFIVTAIVGGTVAVPVILHNAKGDKKPGS